MRTPVLLRTKACLLLAVIALPAAPAAAFREVICTGDCNYDGAARVEELMTGIDILLGRADVDACAGVDRNGDRSVTVDELLGGVRNALDGCPSARFEPVPCDPEIVPEGQDPARMRCGFAIVPEHRDRHDGSTIRVAVAVLRATGPAPEPDPIIHLGPGIGSILGGLMQVFTADFAAPLQHDRDLVFFDHRGTGRSTPSLACPELLTVSDAYATDQSLEADSARDVDDLLACHDRLAAEGVDFADYTTTGIAADARDILGALGYTRWNLYGWSQSTRIAQVLMRDSPAGEIRSVVLDSPIPIRRPHLIELARHLERTLRLIISDCGADAGCNHAFPDLEQAIFGLVPALNAAPLTLEPTDPVTGQPFRIVASGDLLVLFLSQAMQDTALSAFVPLLAQQLAARNAGLLTAGASTFAGAARGDATVTSVVCQDQIPLETPEAQAEAAQGVDPNLVHALQVSDFLATACRRGWSGLSQISAPPASVSSDIPTLILSGEYDPATPPEFAHEVAATLSQSTVVELRGHAHGELYVNDGAPGSPGCAMRVTAQHYNHPQHAVDASCAALLPPPHFVGS